MSHVCQSLSNSRCSNRIAVLVFLVSLFQEEWPIYDAFSQEEFTSKFISFLSLEDRKGKDKFNIHRFVLFKVRKQVYLDRFVDMFSHTFIVCFVRVENH